MKDSHLNPFDLNSTAQVLSVGAMPFKPPIPGIDREGNLSLRNLQDMDKIMAWIDKVHAFLRRALSLAPLSTFLPRPWRLDSHCHP